MFSVIVYYQMIKERNGEDLSVLIKNPEQLAKVVQENPFNDS